MLYEELYGDGLSECIGGFMIKLLHMFPGVGSQYSGMGKYLYDNFDVVRHTLEEASDTLGINIPSLCFEKERGEELHVIEHSQVALVALSIATYRVFLQETSYEADFMLGYSLGEYSALCAAGSLYFADALKLVFERGKIIKHYSTLIDGTMAWVTNLSPVTVEQLCEQVSELGESIYVSAYDTSLKTSVSGTRKAVQIIGDMVVEQGGILIPLKMSGPFHSPMMQEAADRYLEILSGVKVAVPQITVIANHNGKPYSDAGSILKNLYLQVVSPVRLLDSFNYLIDQGLTAAIEIGPKDVMKYMLKAVQPTLPVYTYEKEKDVLHTHQSLLVQQTDYEEIMAQCLCIVAGTKNNNPHSSHYMERVILPYRRIQSRLEKLVSAGVIPTSQDVSDALQMLKDALEEKNIDTMEREQYSLEVLQGKRWNITSLRGNDGAV